MEKEVIDKIMVENGKDIENYKAQVAALTTEKDNLIAQLADANHQIEDFKELDIEGIKNAAKERKKKFEAAEAKADIEALQLDAALNSAF